ncbi:hypothetical protein [Limimaricola soesokkakensis]|uniref:hypothetical protein n=1 Tax=Limimaricola soesokkakensis TaxID=1343159 RepID=UPI003514DF97
MFDIYLQSSSALAALRAFVEQQSDGLLNAAELLGGPGGLRLARSAIDGLGRSYPPSKRTLEACGELLDLLMLEHVDDVSRVEAERFAALDPAWPVVEEICLLADGFQNVLEAYLDEACQQAAQVAA